MSVVARFSVWRSGWRDGDHNHMSTPGIHKALCGRRTGNMSYLGSYNDDDLSPAILEVDNVCATCLVRAQKEVTKRKAKAVEEALAPKTNRPWSRGKPNMQNIPVPK